MTRLRRAPPAPEEEPGRSATAEAWIEASRRMADGRPDAAAHLEAAWHGTEAWWLRPFAHVVAISLGVSAGVPRRVAEAGDALRSLAAKVLLPKAVRPAPGPQTVEGRKPYITKDDGPAAVRALRRLELPFFAASAAWEDRPARGLVLTGRVRPSLQDRLLEVESETRSTLEEVLGKELGLPVCVHLLRAQAEDGEEQRDGAPPSFNLFVTEAAQEGRDEGALGYSLMSVAVALVFCSQIGSPFFTKIAGAGAALLAPGSAPALGMLFGLLLFGEAVRAVVTGCLGGSWTPPVFLPSPQLGLIGSVPAGREAPYGSRTAALCGALAGPLAVAAGSALLVAAIPILGPVAGGAAVEVPLGIAWPLAALPLHCSVPLWAGAHGLLVAGLMLLPQSPAGQAAWQSLVGRKAADKAAEVAAYLYPLLGIVCASSANPGWFLLPLWWAILMVNVGPTETQPALEEVSEVPGPLRFAAGAVLCAAAVALVPLPLHELLPSLAAAGR